MSNCDCHSETHHATRRVLQIAFALNASMFVIGIVFGLIAHSSGLIADALDMLADAMAYALALYALAAMPSVKARLATLSGWILIALGIGVLCDVLRRTLYGEEPQGSTMMVLALVSLCVNATVLTFLSKHKGTNVNVWASWICTRADVVANLGVILAGFLVFLTTSKIPDLIIGAAISLYVLREAMEILRGARRAIINLEQRSHEQ